MTKANESNIETAEQAAGTLRDSLADTGIDMLLTPAEVAALPVDSGFHPILRWHTGSEANRDYIGIEYVIRKGRNGKDSYGISVRKVMGRPSSPLWLPLAAVPDAEVWASMMDAVADFNAAVAKEATVAMPAARVAKLREAGFTDAQIAAIAATA